MCSVVNYCAIQDLTGIITAVQSPVTFGEVLTARRKQLGLSQSAAARKASVDRMTWRAWEEDRSTPQDYNYVKIEHALEWEPGSVEAKLSQGRTPEPAQSRAERDELRDETEQQMWAIGKEGGLSEDHIWLRIYQRRTLRERRIEREESRARRDDTA